MSIISGSTFLSFVVDAMTLVQINVPVPGSGEVGQDKIHVTNNQDDPNTAASPRVSSAGMQLAWIRFARRCPTRDTLMVYHVCSGHVDCTRTFTYYCHIVWCCCLHKKYHDQNSPSATTGHRPALSTKLAHKSHTQKKSLCGKKSLRKRKWH